MQKSILDCGRTQFLSQQPPYTEIGAWKSGMNRLLRLQAWILKHAFTNVGSSSPLRCGMLFLWGCRGTSTQVNVTTERILTILWQSSRLVSRRHS